MKLNDEVKELIKRKIASSTGMRESDMCAMAGDRLSKHPIGQQLIDLRNELGNYWETEITKRGKDWFKSSSNRKEFEAEKLKMQIKIYSLVKEAEAEKMKMNSEFAPVIREFLVAEYGAVKLDDFNQALFFGDHVSGLILADNRKLHLQARYTGKPFYGYRTASQ
ncbi:hypothetical protein KAT51_07540 [bacterium]|nr:hypothetical protein [bacterium]